MGQAAQGRSVPALATLRQQRASLDRELAELEKRKLVAVQGGRVTVTIAGFRALRRFQRTSR